MAGPVRSHSIYEVPDGGWGWVVCFASFVLQLLTIGITYTFGVLFVDLLDYFGESEATTSWIGSIQPCMLYLTGIVAGPLIQRFGWRAVTIAGSIISAIGFGTSALVNNIYWLYLTYGFLTGVGNGLMYVTSMVAVQHYFEKKRAMATGLAVSGSGVGTLIFGFATRSLLDRLGWRWTMVVQAGIILLGVFCGALYRPLPERSTAISHEEEEEIDDEKAHLTTSGGTGTSYGSSKQTGSQAQVVEEEEEEDEIPASAKGCGAMCSQIFDASLLKNPIFVIYCITIILFCFGYHVPYTYTPERATKAFGIDTQSASMLVSVMGISNVVSRLLFGWLADRSTGIRFYMGGITLTLGGLSSVFIFLFTTYPLMILYSVLFGGFTGCWASLFPVILVDLLGIEVIEKSLGQCLASGSIAFLVASPMAGWIIETTGSYDAPFMVVGAMMAAGGLIYFVNKCLMPKYGYQPPEEVHFEVAKRRARKHRRTSYASESFA